MRNPAAIGRADGLLTGRGEGCHRHGQRHGVALLLGVPTFQHPRRLRIELGHFSGRSRTCRSAIQRFWGQISGGGGNRTTGSSSDADDSRTVSRTGIDENTPKEHEQNALPDILMTMSQIPDVNRELAEVSALNALFAAVLRSKEW